MAESIVRCRPYVRTATDGGWHYDPIYISSPESDGTLHTTHPPAVGDLIWLWDSLAKAGGMYRVVNRSWHHVGYGSMVWPYSETVPRHGPELVLMVEPAAGAFVDQVLRPEEQEEGDDDAE